VTKLRVLIRGQLHNGDAVLRSALAEEVESVYLGIDPAHVGDAVVDLPDDIYSLTVPFKRHLEDLATAARRVTANQEMPGSASSKGSGQLPALVTWHCE
jgi:hypothetical protein